MTFWWPYVLVLLVGCGTVFPFWFSLDTSEDMTSRFNRDMLEIYFILSGASAGLIWIQVYNMQIRLSVLVWAISVLAVVLYGLWIKVSSRLLMLPSLFGLIVLHRYSTYQIPVYPQWIQELTILLSASLLVIAIHLVFSQLKADRTPDKTNLNHRRILAFLILLAVRLVWDVGYILVAGTEDDYGIRLPLYRFLAENELRLSLTYGLTSWFFPLLISAVLYFKGRQFSGTIWRWVGTILILLLCIGLTVGGYFLLNYGYVL